MAHEKDKIEQMMYANVRRSQNEVLVSACDKEILGKTFSEKDIHLSVSKDFYEGDILPVKGLSNLLSRATTANLTGNRVVEEAIKLGFVDEAQILLVCGIKHAQIVFL